MPRLKVNLRGAQISDIGLNPEKEYIAGRKENCDIRLQAEKGISREHFKLKVEEGRWVIQSLSRFGEIYSQGQRVETISLEHGLTFQVPPYDFQFSDLPESSIVSEQQEPLEIDENERTVIGASRQVPYIKMMSAQGEVREMLRLEIGDTWVAGRDPSCQIVIPDQRVSRRQFEVRKVNGAYNIIDLASVNGTFLNGSPISSVETSPLKSGDGISVLDNIMYFELHDPNFQYRMDRIEIPPLQLVQSEEEYEQVPQDYANGDQQPQDPMMLQEIEQPYVDPMNPPFDPQMNQGPFTGMPNAEGLEGQQYYTFNPEQQGPPPQVSKYSWDQVKNNKPLLAAIVLIILGGAFYISENMGQKNIPVATEKSNSTDPFLRLKPEEQNTIKDLYSLAQKSMLQQKYSLARENLDKIHQLLPTGYMDSLSMRDEAITNEETIIQTQNQERLEKERQEQEKKIAETVAICKKLLVPDLNIDQVKDCMAPVVLIDPTNIEYIKLMEEAQKIVNDKRAKEDQKLAFESQVEQLTKLFMRAEKIQGDGYPFKAIRAYTEVIKNDLPDPENLKEKAQKRIQYIEGKIAFRTAENIKQADVYIQEGKLKEAVIALRSSLVYDPENKKLKDKILLHTEELRKKVMTIYQESIIDENFGNIEGDETRPGAKEKWKKIVEMDLDDGEYYKKAYIKLKRYGAL